MTYDGIVNILDNSCKSAGTGFFITANGYILTCCHVLTNSKFDAIASRVPYKHDNNETIHFAVVKAINEQKDIALLHTDIPSSTYYPLREYIGGNDNIFSTLGFPKGKYGIPAKNIKYDALIGNGQRILLENANRITYGYSGAPLVNKYNESIGMIAWIPNDTGSRMDNEIFAIPANVILETFSEYLWSSDKVQVLTKRFHDSGKNDWTKGVIAFHSDSDAAECVARVYFSVIKKHPYSSVILPTGRSATKVFSAMVRIADEFDGCPFGGVRIISDTETFGVWNDHETSRTRNIYESLINPLRQIQKAPKVEQLNLLSGVYTDSDPIKYAKKTVRMFPPSVHAISVSPTGEILAYEVDTYNEINEIIYDEPRIVELGAQSKKYIDPNQPSKSVISIGAGTALSANVLLILVFDIQKAKILNRLFTGPTTARIPATLLRYHSNAFVLTTERVAHKAKVDSIVMGKMDAKEAARWIVAR